MEMFQEREREREIIRIVCQISWGNENSSHSLLSSYQHVGEHTTSTKNCVKCTPRKTKVCKNVIIVV